MVKKIKLSFYILICFLWPVSCFADVYNVEQCIGCHYQGSTESSLQISIQEFRNSIHGNEITCIDCHSNCEDEKHESIEASGAVDCGQCHEQENMHGSGAERDDRPQCYSCHGKHNILDKSDRNSTVHREQLKDTCRECHPMESGETGYLSFLPSLQIRSHKKQDFSRDFQRTNCIGCHQGRAAHGEKEPVDTQDCHICHMSLKNHLSITGYIHPQVDLEKQPVIFIAAVIYPVFILFILCGVVRFVFVRFSGKSNKQE